MYKHLYLLVTVFLTFLSQLSAELSIKGCGALPHNLKEDFILTLDRSGVKDDFLTILLGNEHENLEKLSVDLNKDLLFENGTYMTQLMFTSNESKINIKFSRHSHGKALEIYRSKNIVMENRIYRELLVFVNAPILTLKTSTVYQNGSQIFLVICESREGLSMLYPRIRLEGNKTAEIVSNNRDKKNNAMVTTMKVRPQKNDDGAPISCTDSGVRTVSKILFYSHPDKVVISPSSRLSVAKGENFECGVVGVRSNISLKWTVNVDEIGQESLYTNQESLGPHRSRLTLTRAADWATLRLGCEAVSTVNKDSKTLKASVPPLLIRPMDFPDQIDARMSSLIRSFKRMFAPKNSLNRKVDNTTGGSVDRPKSAPKNSFIWKVDNFTEGPMIRSSPKFFSHSGGYRMQIYLYTTDSRRYINFWFRLWKGENDAHLSWPFKGNVTMSVVDQRDNSNVYSRSRQYDSMDNEDKGHCRRPSALYIRRIHIGGIEQPSIEDRVSEIIRNGSMIIRCEVTFPN